jgi:ribosomal protein S18 acetylase RimI-like enzyme
MDAARERRLRFRVLGPSDRAEAAAIAGKAFAGNRFYEDAFGLDREGFAAYWDAFLSLALCDRSARVLGVEADGRLEALVVVAYHGFPSAGGALRFVSRLTSRIGLRRAWGYLRFLAGYDRAMRRPRCEERREARGLWLMADPQAARPRVGAALMRFTAGYLRAEGKEILTGFVDAGNVPLLAFYRRLGYRIGPRFRFAGHWATVAELKRGGAPC